MRITSLGHAGFCVETARTIVVTDPWLSPAGAFDSAWFQLPRNHHLAAYVQEKLADARKERFLYISHEHKDHLDLAFLNSIDARDFTVVIPDFRRPALRSQLERYPCRQVIACAEGDVVPTPDGFLKLYLDDSELNRDSAILIRAGERSFLNLNDCRIADALPSIRRQEGPVDVFACQFSGAGWHPTCYRYPREVYEEISRKKVLAKFHGVAQALKRLEPRVYLPSAGPPCFLDPALFHLNLEPVNIFPRAPSLISFLDSRMNGSRTTWPELMPGDVLDAETGTVVQRARERVTEESFPAYVAAYAAAYEGFFLERQRRYSEEPFGDLVSALTGELEGKLSRLTLRHRVRSPLYFQLVGGPGATLRVDFAERRVDLVDRIAEAEYYAISAEAWEVARVLDGKITWDDFSLAFRMRLDRQPDVYQTILQGFLRLEPEDLDWFCEKLLNIENNQERIVVEAGGHRYVVDRYCPHQGGDLVRGWVEGDRFLVCPRHQWQFDLEDEGQACGNAGGIHAVCLDDD